ncbi:hypothetical protein MNBD_GAMMA09-2888 [hydrothermal vent metagenome]|uniref:IS66 family insertion sequence element accessory protein TnpB n=1 Tax=hydrothermal vent metagenome TaxID=652676 RepID=A0A3B0XDM1_9ZZZZ
MTAPDKNTAKAVFWQHHIQQWRTAQLTQIAYCREHDLNFHQFNYWLRKEEPVNTQKNKAATPSSAASSFVPVVKHQAALAGLSLRLPNGMLLQGIESGNISTVKQLLALLS